MHYFHLISGVRSLFQIRPSTPHHLVAHQFITIMSSIACNQPRVILSDHLLGPFLDLFAYLKKAKHLRQLRCTLSANQCTLTLRSTHKACRWTLGLHMHSGATAAAARPYTNDVSLRDRHWL